MSKTNMSTWELNSLDKQLINIALQEDLGLPHQDVTTTLLFPKTKRIKAHILSKHTHPMVLCGLPVVRHILGTLDHDYQVMSDFSEGDSILPGQTLFTIIASSHALLMAERVILNFLQHLSSIATATNQYVEQIKHTSTQILDTRKTRPGFRHLDKYAVQCGKGMNHRLGLYDAIMIKDTHVDALGGMEKTLHGLPADILKQYPVIIEVRSMDELTIVLTHGLTKMTRVLLDNMSPELIKKCVSLCHSVIQTEASGNIHLQNVKQIADCGVDFISIGKITHSAGHIDLSMISE